jgi:hypothetical protein
VTIPVASVEDVIKIPNAALHYRPSLPPEQIRAVYKRFGIAETEQEDGRSASSDGGAGQPTGNARPGSDDPTAVVWKRGSGEPEPVEVVLGITDHAFTAATRIVVGRLAEGDPLVTRAIQARSGAPTGQGARR